MFIVKRITLENFMNVEHAEIEFDSRQITAFVGDNGMGKSTLVYAIALAFSGYKKGEKYQSYVRSGSPYARVTMDAILFGHPASYDITIVSDSAKKEKVTNKKSLTYKGQTYVNNDYTAFIKEHNLDSLESIVFMFQGASDITDAKPSEISDMLKSIFGFDSISDAADSIKSKQTDVKNESIENELSSELKLMKCGMFIQEKYSPAVYQVLEIDEFSVRISKKDSIVTWYDLLKHFEFLDGSKCGKLYEGLED